MNVRGFPTGPLVRASPLIAQIVPSSHGFSGQVGHAEDETSGNFLGFGGTRPKL